MNPLLKPQSLRTAFLVLVLLTFSVGIAQKCIWIKGFETGSYAGNYGKVECKGSAIAKNGNLYFAGEFNSKTLQIESAVLVNTRYVPGYETEDAFITCFDTTGKLLWAKKFGGSKRDNLSGITTDSEGNAIIFGFTEDATVTLGASKTKLPGSFIVKFDQSGNISWVKNMAGTGDLTIKTDAENNLYCTGAFSYPLTFDAITLKHSEGNKNDIFVAKFDKRGKALWAHTIGGEGNDLGNAITLDTSGNVIVFAEFRSKQINIGDNILTGSGSSISPEIFCVKYNNSGNVLWAKKTSHGARLSTLCTCDKLGNIYVTESCVPEGAYVTVYDPEGKLIKDHNYSLDKINAMSIDKNNCLHYGGEFKSQKIVFGADTVINSNTIEKEEKWHSDGFLFNFDQNGKPYSQYTCHGLSGESDEQVTGIIIDNSGAIYVSGNFNQNSIRSGSCELTFPEQHSGFFIMKILPPK